MTQIPQTRPELPPLVPGVVSGPGVTSRGVGRGGGEAEQLGFGRVWKNSLVLPAHGCGCPYDFRLPTSSPEGSVRLLLVWTNANIQVLGQKRLDKGSGQRMD